MSGMGPVAQTSVWFDGQVKVTTPSERFYFISWPRFNCMTPCVRSNRLREGFKGIFLSHLSF